VPQDTADEAQIDRFDAMLTSKTACYFAEDSFRRNYFDRLTAFDYSVRGLLTRVVQSRYQSNVDFTISRKDSFTYNDDKQIVNWNYRELSPPHAINRAKERDSLHLRHIWTFEYNSQHRVVAAEHRIWHSPPPALDSFYAKVIERFKFEYNPDRTMSGFSKERKELARFSPDNRPISQESQQFKIGYSYFPRRRIPGSGKHH